VANKDNEEPELILAPILLLADQGADPYELAAIDRDILKEPIAENVINSYIFWLSYRAKAFQNSQFSPKKARIIPFDLNDFLSAP
jgi:hypothetical protein